MKKTILMGLLALAMSSCGGYKPYRFYSKVNTISTVENDKATKAESHMKSLVDRSVESDSTTPTLQDLKAVEDIRHFSESNQNENFT